MNLCLSKVTIHSLSHNCPIEMKLEWRLGNISACFAWLDNCFSGIWACCVDAILDELGSFTSIGFLMAPLCGLLLSGHLGSVLCIMSRLLGFFCGVVVRIEYY